jgi:hypothetical protein
MKNQQDIVKKLITIPFLAIAMPGISLLGQEGGDAGGGGDAAAAAVTSGGASKPAAAASGSNESNPVVTMVRAGVSWQAAKTIKIVDIVKIASAGGTLTKLSETAGKIQTGTLKTNDLVTLLDAGIDIDNASDNAEFATSGTINIDDLVTLVEKGVSIADASSNAVKAKSGTINLADLTTLIDAGVSITDASSNAEKAKAGTINLADLTTLLSSGISIADASANAEKAKAGTLNITALVTLIDSGVSLEDASSISESGGSSSFKTALFTSTRALTTNNALYTATTQVISGAATEFTGFQTALEASVILANTILTDKVITTADDLPDSISVSSLAQSGYTTELIRLLAKYGAIGSNGDALASAVLGTEYAAFTSSQSLTSLVKNSTSSYLANLANLGARTFAIEDSGSSVLNVSLSNISLAPAANISITSGAIIDASDALTKALSTSDRKIAVLGAAKDLTFAGDATFTNSNDVEDHALVIGAADDLYFRSEYSSANTADYADPDPVTVKYTGSNLALGSHDTMRLVNVNLETGGNLALATLDELHIGLSDSHSSTFSVGTGGKNSDPDNVYLYANNLIQVNGLQFSGRLDDVYLEAITINLKDVQFPSTADVMLRSRDGSLNFNSYASPVIGSVNLTEVSHGGTTLNSSHFNGVNGHIDSSITLPNGTSAIKIRGQ